MLRALLHVGAPEDRAVHQQERVHHRGGEGHQLLRVSCGGRQADRDREFGWGFVWLAVFGGGGGTVRGLSGFRVHWHQLLRVSSRGRQADRGGEWSRLFFCQNLLGVSLGVVLV